MFRILLATDGSPDAEAARQFVASLPLKEGGAVHLLCVASEPLLLSGGYGSEAPLMNQEIIQQVLDTERSRGEAVLRETAAALRQQGLDVTTELRSGDAAHQIIEAADDLGADLVAVGSTGLTGLEAFLLGSVARNVAKHARRPVLVARAPRHGLRRVILAVDESEHASQAVHFATRMPLPAETEILAVHAARRAATPALLLGEPESYLGVLEEARARHLEVANRLVNGACAELQARGRNAAPVVLEGDPAEEVLQLAEERQADLILAGARGVSLIKGLVVGSVADRLLKAARCSVLLVH